MHQTAPSQVTMRVCSSCGWLFTDKDTSKVDYVIPCVQEGAHDLANIQTLLRYRHNQQCALDASLPPADRNISLTTAYVTEEPDEALASRPILMTSRSREETTYFNKQFLVEVR